MRQTLINSALRSYIESAQTPALRFGLRPAGRAALPLKFFAGAWGVALLLPVCHLPSAHFYVNVLL